MGRPRSGKRSAASRRRQAAPGRAPVGVADADGGEVVGAGWAVDGRHPVVEVPVAHRRREEPAEDAHVRPVHHRLRPRGGGGFSAVLAATPGGRQAPMEGAVAPFRPATGARACAAAANQAFYGLKSLESVKCKMLLRTMSNVFFVRRGAAPA